MMMLCSVPLQQTAVFAQTGAGTETAAAPKGLIYALGIVPANANLSGSVSRGAFAELITSFMQYDMSAGETTQLFQDVSPSSASSKAINAVYRLGYMNGDGNGCFRPDDAITYPEVLTVVVKMLGHGSIMSATPQYSVSYMAQAAQLRLTLNKADDAITAGEIYLILERALEAPFHRIIGVVGDSNILSDGKTTVLEEIYQVYKQRGIVTQNYQTSLYDADGGSGRKEQVVIDDFLLYTEDLTVADHLGEEVEYYYKTEDQIDTLIYYTVTKSNEILTIDADMLLGYVDGTLKYTEENSRGKQAQISERANILYNGTYYKKGYALSAEDFVFSAGKVKLIANESGDYTTVCITDYRFGIFDRLSSKEEISMKKTTDIYALENYDTVTIWKGGEMIAAAGLAEWDVLNILEDRQKQNLTIYVTNETVEGTLEEIYTQSSGKMMTIGGAVYKVNDMYDVVNEREAKLGRKEVFLLDMFGSVIALQQAESVIGKYGVILDIGGKDTFGGTIQIKFLNSKNRMKVYDITTKTLINGKKYDSAQLAQLAGDKEALKGKPLRFETNSAGELTELYIEYDTGYETVLKKKMDNTRKRYKSGQQFFGDAEVAVRGNTSIFVVGNQIDDDEDCSCVTRSYLENDVYYNISTYNYDEYNIADLIILHEDNAGGGESKIDADSPVYISEGLVMGVNGDGETVYKLTGMYNGERCDRQYWFDSEATFDRESLKAGSIFQIKTNGKGKILAVNVLQTYDPDNLNFYYNSSSILGKVFGRVARVASDKFMLNVSNSEEEDLRILMPKGNIYMYDTEEKKVRLGTAADIMPGNILFIRDRYQDAKDMVIFSD